MMRRWLAVGTLVFLLTACGNTATPVDAAPELGGRLHEVDVAIASHDYAAARRALDALVKATNQSEREGHLPAADADAIRSAAKTLTERLPTLSNPGSVSQPESSPSASQSPGETHGEDDESDDGEDEESDEGGD